MLEHLDHLAAASAEAISKIKFDKVVVWENGGQNGTTNTASFLHGMARTLPPMMQVLRDIGGIEIPDSLVKVSHNEPVTTASSNGAAAHAAEPPKSVVG